jgi:hypothetical protein
MTLMVRLYANVPHLNDTHPTEQGWSPSGARRGCKQSVITKRMSTDTSLSSRGYLINSLVRNQISVDFAKIHFQVAGLVSCSKLQTSLLAYLHSAYWLHDISAICNPRAPREVTQQLSACLCEFAWRIPITTSPTFPLNVVIYSSRTCFLTLDLQFPVHYTCLEQECISYTSGHLHPYFYATRAKLLAFAQIQARGSPRWSYLIYIYRKLL